MYGRGVRFKNPGLPDLVDHEITTLGDDGEAWGAGSMDSSCAHDVSEGHLKSFRRFALLFP